MRLISITLFMFMGACASQPKQHTYLKYSGYIEGCADATLTIVMQNNPDITLENVNRTALDAMCMELYLIKLDADNIKPPMTRFDRNETI